MSETTGIRDFPRRVHGAVRRVGDRFAGSPESAAAAWGFLRPYVAAERRFAGRMMARGPFAAAGYEFLRFGMKQAWACLFGGIMLALLIATHYWYPRDAALARYDFLFLAALTVQAGLLAFRLETFEEAKVILAYHIVGTVMEIFKTAQGSWIYPDPSFFHIGGVPLFTGFMYSCIGSYLCRAWRLFHLRFTGQPPLWALGLVSAASYANFFTHHYVVDLRLVLFAAAAALLWRTRVYFVVWRKARWMPLLLGFVLIAAFIWFAENIGTYTRTWLYPGQREAWTIVGLPKLGSWFLLVIISFALVALIKRRDYQAREEGPARDNRRAP
ncbi:DUF817 domain-containing protein [Bauldia sp.]|uniref:DUF817 domain-containing protein n=1 Tax=Bauldia sp. TaxID=2575872 RepID=UPI0025C5C8B5|nr:DUF817 domain-containing protein [Bauldia sp.]